MNKPSNENGMVYEILGYKWLYDHYVIFGLHPSLEKEECLKEKAKEYVADGQIENIVFDIKAFSFGMPRYVELSKKINQLLRENKCIRVSDFIKDNKSDNCKEMTVDPEKKEPVLGDYNIMISGKADLASKYFEYKFEGKELQILKELFSQSPNHNDYMYKYDSLVLRAHYRKRFMTAHSSFNSDEWAMNNQYQLLKHGSQFSRNNPFIIICTYDDYKCNRLFGTHDRYYTFKTLCRRMFMLHTKMEERKLYEFDGKADRNISVAMAARKLSGVLFLDVSDTPDNFGDFLFVNPNADNPMLGYQIDSFFRCNGVSVEDYMYDNY